MVIELKIRKGQRVPPTKRLTYEQFLDWADEDTYAEWVDGEKVLRDRGAKYGEYEAGGVREYWVFDPEAQRADFFILSDDGRYERAHPDREGVYHSAVLPEFWLNVNWLWRQPLPTLRQVLQEWEKPS